MSIFSEMTTSEALDKLTEKRILTNEIRENVIHICNIPNDRYISCNRYIAKSKDGVIDFIATQHHGVNVDEMIDIHRILFSNDGKEKIEEEINRIREQSEERIQHEKIILKHLSF